MQSNRLLKNIYDYMTVYNNNNFEICIFFVDNSFLSIFVTEGKLDVLFTILEVF